MAEFSSSPRAESPPPAVGSVVRVWTSEAKERSRLAVVALVDGNECDVVFGDDAPGEAEEESAVRLSRLTPAEPFEASSGEAAPVDAIALKERGNALLTKHKDALAAEKMYVKALAALLPSPPYTVGTTVLLLPKDPQRRVNLRSATVADYTPGGPATYDVIVDAAGDNGGEDGEERGGQEQQEEEEEEEEELTVPASVVVAALAASPEGGELQRGLYCNMARCLLRREIWGWAVRHASLALACARLLSPRGGGAGGGSKGEVDALVLRGKALLGAGTARTALRDAAALRRLGGSAGQAGAAALEKAAEALLRDRQRSNRQMAKDLAKWADVAMRQGGHLGVAEMPGEDD